MTARASDPFPPLRKGGEEGWSRRNQGLVRGSGAAEPRGITADSRLTKVLVMPCSPPLTLGW